MQDEVKSHGSEEHCPSQTNGLLYEQDVDGSLCRGSPSQYYPCWWAPQQDWKVLLEQMWGMLHKDKGGNILCPGENAIPGP